MAAPVSGLERAALSRALGLALNGRGRVSPNPLVGAVILRDGEVAAEGWHEGPGLPHAEAMALAQAGDAARGATVVCTLEPCSHTGRTPPCADALVAAGVARVVIGLLDPLERERAQGREVLAAAGVEVAVADGAEAAACAEINAPFLTAAVTGRPHVTLKLATSLDGKIATAAGESRWISGPASRGLVHRWRADSDAVAVGLGTALADDPLLSARDVAGPVRQPARVVFDSGARLPPDAALVRDLATAPVIVIAAADADAGRVAALRAEGVNVVPVPGDPAARLAAGLEALGERGIQSLFVEGGAQLAGALVAAGAVDRVAWFLAPTLIGGREAPSALGGDGVAALAAAPRLRGVETERVGDDILVTGRLRPLAGTEGEAVFTGLVEEGGRIREVRPAEGGARLSIGARRVLEDLAPGDSVAVNGACLTAVEIDAGGFAVDCVAETLRRTTLGGLAAGDAVNLERPMRLGDRLDGHLVQGHVDGVGVVRAVRAEGESAVLEVFAPAALLRYVVEKGSITVDGVSLTVAARLPDAFTVALIPHTMEVTTLGPQALERPVNLEVDVVAKYVESLAAPYAPEGTGG